MLHASHRLSFDSAQDDLTRVVTLSGVEACEKSEKALVLRYTSFYEWKFRAKLNY